MIMDRIDTIPATPNSTRPKRWSSSVSLVSLSVAALAVLLPKQATAQSGSSASGNGVASSAAGGASTSSFSAGGGEEVRDITLSVTGRYDSNVAQAGNLNFNNRARGSDFKISPNLQIGVSKNLGPHTVGVRSNLGYVFYTKNPDLNRERLSVSPFAFLNLPVCDLALNATASRQQSEIQNLVIVDGDPDFGLSNRETLKSAQAELICGDEVGLRPRFQFSKSSGDNSNPFREVANFRSTRFQTSLDYSSPVLGEIGVYAVKQDTDLPNQLLLGGAQSGTRITSYGLHYGRALGTRLKFNGSVGRTKISPYDSQLPARTGLNWSASLNLLASSRLQVSGVVSRAFTNTLTTNATYEVSTSYIANATYAVNDRLRLNAGAAISPREFVYPASPLVPLTGPLVTSQKQNDFYAGAEYRLNQRLRLTATGGYTRRTTDQALFNYDSVYAALGLSLSL